jgi:hypothetical protein
MLKPAYRSEHTDSQSFAASYSSEEYIAYDVQQVGHVSKDGVSWDVQSLLTLKGARRCSTTLYRPRVSPSLLGVAIGQN